MTIGELLKDYRIKQGKNQREFIAGIVSQSYYSKVEKEIHRITADDLLKILNHNGIPVKEFFEKLEIDPNQWQIDKINKLMEEITKASYSEQAIDQIRKIREKVKKLDLNPELKEEALLIIDGFIELEKDDPETFDEKLRTKLKEKVLICGKGADPYQKIRGVDTPYPTDIKVAESVINELEKDDEE